MLIAGLTGNYGMGKSAVLSMFRELGAVTANADEIVNSLLKDESVLHRIKMALGDNVLSKDGTFDRARVASIIFRDKRKRDAIEDILHPLVFQRIGDFIERMDKEDTRRVVIVEIPLMFERKYLKGFHKTITVYADEDVVLRRLGRSGISRDDALIRLNAQMPIEEKIKLSDFAINNNGSPDDTMAQVKKIYERLVEDLG